MMITETTLEGMGFKYIEGSTNPKYYRYSCHRDEEFLIGWTEECLWSYYGSFGEDTFRRKTFITLPNLIDLFAECHVSCGIERHKLEIRQLLGLG